MKAPTIRLTALSAVVLLVPVALSQGQVPISPGGSFSPAASMVYQEPFPPDTPGMWDVATTLDDGAIKPASGIGKEFIFKPEMATILWTGNQLDQDLSSPAGTTPALAEATFLGGGTLTIMGTIYSASGFKPAVYSGPDPILVAEIGPMHLRETDINGNALTAIGGFQMTPTGGWLYENSTLQLRGVYDVTLVMASVGPTIGGDLDNFQSSLAQLNGFQMTFNIIPEPASILLLVLGGLMFGTRRMIPRV